MLYLDLETRSSISIGAGTYKYATGADILIVAYAFDDEPAEVVATGRPLTFADLPERLRAYLEGDGMIVAHNAGFDRTQLNYAPSFEGGPYFPPERFYDSLAQAVASNLPPDLEGAAKLLTTYGKDKSGRQYLRLFSIDGADPAAHPAEWKAYCGYASRDVEAMRDVWRMTRKLTDADWLVYWASENANERGIGIDRPFVENAARLAKEAEAVGNARVRELTGGKVKTVKSHKALAAWVYDRLDDHEAIDLMTLRYADTGEENGEEDESDGDAKLLEDEISIGRDIVERLIAFLESRQSNDTVLREVLELRLYGASAAPTKFAKMLEQETDGRLRGQFKFNGAAQTGRWSGTGVQLQNMTRKVLGADPGDDYGFWEAPTVDLIADGCTLAELAAHGLGESAMRKLALVVRPALVAKEGFTFIKSDYSQIEARVLPWLSCGGGDTHDSALILLDAFDNIDRDPAAPDIYKVAAAGMLGITPFDVSKEQRQVGKVATLALGFSGGVKALTSMAKNYGTHFSADEAQRTVRLWRDANPWAPLFWGQHGRNGSYGLWGAAMRAYSYPGHEERAGRVSFYYDVDYLSGTLLMQLPSGRLLTYPYCKWRRHERRDKRTKEVIDVKDTLTFRRPFGFVRMYGGLLAENATQACANDLLREAIYMLDGVWPVVAHAHDEVVIEVANADAERASDDLIRAMRFDRPWAAGLPISADTTARFYYSAAKERAPK